MTTSFLIELKALLEKHKARISWSCHDASDLHGVFGECMRIEAGGKEVARIDGSAFNARDIEGE